MGGRGSLSAARLLLSRIFVPASVSALQKERRSLAANMNLPSAVVCRRGAKMGMRAWRRRWTWCGAIRLCKKAALQLPDSWRGKQMGGDMGGYHATPGGWSPNGVKICAHAPRRRHCGPTGTQQAVAGWQRSADMRH